MNGFLFDLYDLASRILSVYQVITSEEGTAFKYVPR